MTIKELAEQSNLSQQAIIKRCRKGQFELKGVSYIAKNIAKAGAKRAKWNILKIDQANNISSSDEVQSINSSTNSITNGQQPASLEQAKLLMQIKQLQAQTKKTEEQLKENKLKNFAEYVAMQKEIMVNGTAEIKEFVKKHVEKEQDILEWNNLWSNYIETVYNQMSKTLFESL